MKNMSFAMTTEQLLDGSKTVTRRLGWMNLKRGDQVCAVRKCMGLKSGESVERLAVLEILHVHRERLDAIDQADVAREGFPEMTPDEFVGHFCKAMRCRPDQVVTRIKFARVV